MEPRRQVHGDQQRERSHHSWDSDAGHRGVRKAKEFVTGAALDIGTTNIFCPGTARGFVIAPLAGTGPPPVQGESKQR